MPNYLAFGKRNSRGTFQVREIFQYFIRAHNETLSIVAVRIGNPDCSPRRIKS